MKLTPMGKIVALILVVGIAGGVWRYWGILAPTAPVKSTVVPMVPSISESTASTNVQPATAAYVPASDDAGCPAQPEVRLQGYAWNAQMGLLLAAGGAQATKGSLMCKYGVNFKFSRQDDNDKLAEDLESFATQLSQGVSNPTKGSHFVIVMGDGSASFLKGLNDNLSRLGPDYMAKIVDEVGYSHGEDKFMGPASWRDNPQSAMGGVVAGVIRDGDWNIAQKWLSDNGLRTNPDEKTYDPDALNWINANDYIDAGEKYIDGYTEKRAVVVNGHKTGEIKTITVQGVVTWTPGDVNVAMKKGGLVSIASTRDYDKQMPAVVIGIDKWCRDNRGIVEGMIKAAGEGGEQVKTSDAALQRGAEVSAKLYNDPGSDAGYWKKYYLGTRQEDKTGETVDLGGSAASDLGDSLLAFGLVPGSANLVADTYTVFGNVDIQQYPELVPSIYPASQIIDTSYLQDVEKAQQGTANVLVAQAKPVYQAAAMQPRALVSRRQWNIQFNAGKSTFTQQALWQLNVLARDLMIAGGTVVEVHGHTDNQGDPRTSMPLSEARAFAVKNYLEHLSPVNFPPGRIQTFAHGQTEPLVPNTSAANRAKNRRVEIVLRQA